MMDYSLTIFLATYALCQAIDLLYCYIKDKVIAYEYRNGTNAFKGNTAPYMLKPFLYQEP